MAGRGADAFVAGTHDAVLDFGAVVLLPALVFFDDHQRDRLYFFVGGEALAALVTLSPSSDGIIIWNRSGIYDTGVVLIAKWTFHLKVLLDMLCKVVTVQYHHSYR